MNNLTIQGEPISKDRWCWWMLILVGQIIEGVASAIPLIIEIHLII